MKIPILKLTLNAVTTSLCLLAIAWPVQADKTNADYAVVVSQKTRQDAGWKAVVEALVIKHRATVLTFTSSVDEVLPPLREQFPRYACFVARPEEVSKEFVAQVSRMTRRLDDDPYTDLFWGILTGYDAGNALRIAQYQVPLTVRKVAAGTDVALEMCEQGVWYDELKKNRMVKKEPGKTALELHGPDDTTAALAGLLNDYQADLFVTSGHATERDWQIGYRYRNGSFRCQNGQLYGLDTQAGRHPIQSPHPKVFLPIGNCLIGHIDGREAMALAYMNSGGVNQMIGYTVTTWYGYAGWGCLDYFVEQPGRYTFAQAFLANQQALIHRLVTYFPEQVAAEVDPNGRPKTRISVNEKAKAAGLTAQDGQGLLYDRDVLAFYGDPAWEARMAKMETAWEQNFSERDALYTLEIVPKRGASTFAPINKNGSQRGGRPIVEFLPNRIKAVELVEGSELQPVITDNFILIPNPGACQPGHKYRVAFRAVRMN